MSRLLSKPQMGGIASVLLMGALALTSSSGTSSYIVADAEAASVFGGCADVESGEDDHCPGCSQSSGIHTEGDCSSKAASESCGSGCGTKNKQASGCE
jgi:hypothetical protein